MSLFERIADAFREPGANSQSESPEHDSEATMADGAGPDDVDDVDDSQLTDAVVAVCQQAPDGIRTYTIEVTAEGGEITEVAPGLLEAHFEVTDGGVGENHVTVRAVDFRGEARHVEAETLVGIRLADPVPLSDVQMRLLSAEDHGGDTLPSKWFRIAAVE